MATRGVAGKIAEYSHTPYNPDQVLKSVTISSKGEELPIRARLEIIAPTGGNGPDRPQYCGETGQSAEERFCGHRNTIIQACHQKTNLPVGSQFQGVGHGHTISDFVFTPL
jgi:hypothetical protein